MDDWRSLVSTGVQSVAAGTQGSPTGALPGLADTVRILGAATAGRGGNQGDRVTAAFNTLQTQYGIDPKEAEAAMRAYTEKKGQAELVLPDKPYDTSTSLRAGTLGGLPGQQNVAGQVYSPFDTEAQANAAFAAAITGSKSGQKYLAAQGIQGTAFQQGVTTGMPMPPAGATTQEDLANLARTGGRLGQRLAGLSTIGAAATATGQPGTQQAAVSTMLNAAMTQAGPGPNQAAQAQALILASTKDVSGALKDVAANAADAAGQLAQIAQVNFSPLQNAINTITTAQATIAAGTAPHASDAEAALVPAARTQLAGGEADLTQQAHQKIQAVKDFNTQQARAQADYNQQVGWANDAFNTQQARSALAYGTSVARSKRDFATQEQRGDYQNNLRISRSTRDFQTGQERNTQQYNLSRTREVRDFDKQQARAAEDYNTSRTRQVRDYNTQTARAQRDFHKDQTRQLQEFNINRGREETQYQLDRSRSIQDFNTQQAQAAEDFHTSQTRELKHFNTQQARAERDYFKQRNRAQQDFDTQMVRNAEKTAQNIYDPWSRIQRKQTASATNLLHNLTNQNQAIQKQIAEIKEAKELGVSEQTIQELDLSNPANAQELDKLIKSMKSNPQMVSSINQQVSKRVAGTKSLTQTADSLDYKNTMEDFLKEQQRGWADYQQSVKDATADLATSMSEQYADFVKTTDRAQKEQAKNLARSEHDHEVAMSQEMTDFKRTTSQASADFATSLHDQWTDLQTSLTDGEADFKKSSIRAKDDLATSLHDQAVDFTTQMANSLHDFKISMADAQSDFLTARANARHDQQVTLSDMKTDYTIASGQAVHDHGVAMSQMETQYNTTLTRAGDDLKTSFQSVTGNLNTSLITMADQAKGQLAEYGPQAVQDYINWINTAANAVGNAAATVPQPAAGGVNYGQPGSATAHDQDPAHYASGQSGGTTGHGVGHAAGGITMAQHLAMVGEAGRELILPLNTHGEKFMGGLMKNAMNLVGGQFGEGRSELDKQEAQKRYEAAQKAEAARRQKQAEDEARRKAIADAAIAKANAEAAKKKAAEEARRKADEAEAKKRHDQEVANANAKKKADAAKAAAGHPVSHPAAHPAAAKPAAHPAAHPAAAAAAADPYTKALEAGFKNITHQLAVGQGNLANVITKALAAVIVPALKAEEAALNRIVTNDNTVSFSGAQIKVIAQDEKAMAKKLLAAAKLKRLTSPVKH
jgi:hypothetical protein